MGEFANFYRRTNGLLGLSAETRGGRTKGSYQFIDLRHSGDDPKGVITINEKAYTKNWVGLGPGHMSYRFCKNECFGGAAGCFCDNDQNLGYFGKEVRMTYTYEDEVRLDESIYLPEILDVSFMPDTTVNWSHPAMQIDDFTLRWNVDERNEYGVLITIDCFGSELHPSPEPPPHEVFLKRSILVPDDAGTYAFEPGIFHNMPSGSYFRITVERGRMPIVEDIDKNEYKLRFTTEHQATITLARRTDEPRKAVYAR